MKSIFLPFIILLTYALNAQPVITSAITPSIGDNWEVTFLEPDFFDTGATGANQTWDYSNLDVSNAFNFNFQILDPNSVLGHEDFPNAAFVLHIPVFEIYEFYETHQDSVSLIGGESISEEEITFKTVFTDPEDALRFPLAFGDSYSYYSFFEQYVFGNLLAQNDRNGTVTADAYGTLITPSGTYTDVLRIIIEETSFGETSTQYAWYDVNNFIPVLLYEVVSDGETAPSLYFATNEIINATKDVIIENAAWKAWPNETANQINIELPVFEDREHIILQLYTIDGKLLTSKAVQNFPQENRHISIDIPNAVNCEHLVLQLKTTKGSTSKKVWVCRN